MSRLKSVLRWGTYLKHIDQCFRKGVQGEFHFGEDYQIRLALDSLGIIFKTHQRPTKGDVIHLRRSLNMRRRELEGLPK
jgi:hypothetical protein